MNETPGTHLQLKVTQIALGLASFSKNEGWQQDKTPNNYFDPLWDLSHPSNSENWP